MRDLLREERGWAGGNPLDWDFLLCDIRIIISTLLCTRLVFVHEKETN